MKIKCTFNNKTSQQECSLSKNTSYKIDEVYEFLDIGKRYNVYGMIIMYGQVWYYICDRVHDLFPIVRPAHLFEIIDNRLSRYWVFGVIEGFEKYPSWNFPEWINEPYFQDSLTDGEEKEVAIFKSYRELMDLEFPDSSINEIAQIGDHEWLICPTCLGAWQYSNTLDALVKMSELSKSIEQPSI